jgi:hypothetical protein
MDMEMEMEKISLEQVKQQYAGQRITIDSDLSRRSVKWS